jgi:hypothetical protein
MLGFALVASLPFTMAAKGGCGPINSTDPAPDVTGQWGIQYGNTMTIDIKIGGAVYHASLPNNGGVFTITHDGKPFEFNIDCSRADVICPSEVWPSEVGVDQRDPMYEHRMWVKIPTQTCSGQLVAPPANQCGAGTLNPECKPVCNGTLTTSSADAFGVIAENGSSFDLLLGGGAATNGINCALLGVSWAHADLTTTGAASSANWEAVTMKNGEVKTAYAGGCLWAGDPQMTGTTQALVLAASVEISTPFTGTRR